MNAHTSIHVHKHIQYTLMNKVKRGLSCLVGHLGKKKEIWHQDFPGSDLFPIAIGCVTLGELHCVSEPSLLHAKSESIIVCTPVELLEAF